jgi:hypothetical protein
MCEIVLTRLWGCYRRPCSATPGVQLRSLDVFRDSMRHPIPGTRLRNSSLKCYSLCCKASLRAVDPILCLNIENLRCDNIPQLLARTMQAAVFRKHHSTNQMNIQRANLHRIAQSEWEINWFWLCGCHLAKT